MTRRIRASLLAAGVAFIVLHSPPSPALAHSGGTDANGCHAGSQPYHCHRPRTTPSQPAQSGGLTLCADGTWSQSTGSGTCSWHGGIAGNNNPPTGSGTTSGGGGTGRIIPDSGPSTTVRTNTPPPSNRTNNNLAEGIGDFFANGGLVVLLVGWWMVSKVRKSRRETATGSVTVRPSIANTGSPTTRIEKPSPSSASIKSNKDYGQAKPASAVSSTTGTCSCGGRQVVRRNRKTGQPFYGCSRYPSCKLTRPMR
jgi:hypothetical protein